MKANLQGGLVAHCREVQKGLIVSVAILLCAFSSHAAGGLSKPPPRVGEASWYGEQHRGLLMANGKKFNPDRLTAASWFYPMGTRLQITRISETSRARRSVIVTVTDRGPAERLVADGRIIDLSHAAFKRLAAPSKGLVRVEVQTLPKP